MGALMLIAVMIGIGAIIGGVTNSLAIKMLFRPYKAVYIGKWRLPFTPGLIPKRRGELAEQMGKMVVNHLLTPERILEKIRENGFRDKMTSWMAEEITSLLQSNSSVMELAGHISDQPLDLDEQMKTWIKKKADGFLDEYHDIPLQHVLPSRLIQKGDEMVPVLAEKITEKGAEFFRGTEGQRQLHLLLEKFLQGKGSMLNFLGSMFGNDKIIEKLQPEIVRFFEDPASQTFLKNVLVDEWEKIKKTPTGFYRSSLPTETLAEEAAAFLKREVGIYRNLQAPLADWAPFFENTLKDRWVPGMVKIGQSVLIDRLPYIFEQFKLDDIVRGQVDTFSVDRLEALVLTISRREFKMITYLGAFLGGIIGLLQGILVLLFSI
ncbi:DUF445 domain-containing protein [Salibacterium aidingense]|uniref:DUF445 domain-containing protein n=1 Tax=Salibacterium aidingense TaxID=384933 RepID=UPI00040FFCAE|nr:DUF445 family protein [Salibacterium aidingense]